MNVRPRTGLRSLLLIPLCASVSAGCGEADRLGAEALRSQGGAVCAGAGHSLPQFLAGDTLRSADHPKTVRDLANGGAEAATAVLEEMQTIRVVESLAPKLDQAILDLDRFRDSMVELWRSPVGFAAAGLAQEMESGGLTSTAKASLDAIGWTGCSGRRAQ